MTKTINTVILFFFGQSVIAQKGIDNLIQAEKNFAAYSVAHSTKEAFQQFIDSNSIMFENGKPVRAIEFWNKREKKPGILNWRPQYAEISASGDFGYTTGPWTFQNSLTDTVIARGQYSTVWHINKKGEWKFLVDLGVNNTSANAAEEVRIIDKRKHAEKEKFRPYIFRLVAAENNFNKSLGKNKLKAYKKTLSKQSILNRHCFLPAVTSANQQALIDSTPSGIKYVMIGWGGPRVPDMGYTYGTAVINDKTESYLRIWRREKNSWKIAVEVLRY
jgi:ketosteroid isomerase-like protein